MSTVYRQTYTVLRVENKTSLLIGVASCGAVGHVLAHCTSIYYVGLCLVSSWQCRVTVTVDLYITHRRDSRTRLRCATASRKSALISASQPVQPGTSTTLSGIRVVVNTTHFRVPTIDSHRCLLSVALVVCTWAHSVQTCGARFPLSPWYCSAIPCWPAAAGGGLGVTQKAAILGLGQTGHPEGATDHHRRPCILYRRSSRLEQFVVIDAECTFVACF